MTWLLNGWHGYKLGICLLFFKSIIWLYFDNLTLFIKNQIQRFKI